MNKKNRKTASFPKSMILALVFAVLLLVCACCLGELPASGRQREAANIGTGYVDTLFDDSYVHTIDIRIEELNLDYMNANAKEEEYVLCDLVIDGELVKNVGIRPKGNSSLASVAASGSEHFSYKIEFDHYQTGNTYRGLDKLALNNLGSDYSCMKDYLAYEMMRCMGVASPLCSYTLVQINGEDFGLYLAVEAVEDSFCERNYGETYGNIYRPDVFAIDSISAGTFMNIDYEALFGDVSTLKAGSRVDILGRVINQAFMDVQEQVAISAMSYAGDKIKTYSTVFDTSVFDLDREDKLDYIRAVKKLNQEDRQAVEALDLDTVMAYFAVHTFVNNYDSYNGVFVHNFYVRESEGKLSFIPWDYNLAFGAFSVESALYSFLGESGYQVEMKLGQSLSSDESYVNYPIDTPMYLVDNEDRPMFYAFAKDEEYLARYHEICQSFLNGYFDSGLFQESYEKIYDLIHPYVERGLTFYETERFEEGASNVKLYCELRKESIQDQLNGKIPTTLKGQEEKPEALIPTKGLNLGKTIDFGGQAFGIRENDVTAILDLLAGEHEHTTQGVSEGIKELSENPGRLMKTIGQVIETNSLLKEAAGQAVNFVLLLFASLCTLFFALKRVKGRGPDKKRSRR